MTVMLHSLGDPGAFGTGTHMSTANPPVGPVPFHLAAHAAQSAGSARVKRETDDIHGCPAAMTSKLCCPRNGTHAMHASPTPAR
ncbi:hypothetical protein [Paracandidimonas soli]